MSAGARAGQKFKDVFFKYNVYDKENKVIGEIDMSLDLESQGTKKLFIIAEFILSALMQGKIVVIDEFNNSLHPAITKFVMQSFNSVDINRANAQLVVNTHDTNLLENKLVRRDQIWFVTKNKFGESELFSLLEYDGVRSDALYEKNYLLGKYGAVPYIDLDAMLSLWVTGEDNGNCRVRLNLHTN